jgi:hypothetical protein
MKLSPERLAAAVNIRLAFLMYLAFFILDLVVYPEFKWPLLMIRLGAAVWIVVMHVALYKIKDENLHILSVLFLFPLAVGISLMCLVVGEGLASPYFVGNILVIMGGGAFLRIKPKVLYFLTLAIWLQHFLILSFIPFTLQDFMLNLFFLVSAAFLASYTHYSILKLTREINSLSGLLPICMYCKKIRDSEGYWNQVERFVAERAQVDFSHSICEECLEKNEKKRGVPNNKTNRGG